MSGKELTHSQAVARLKDIFDEIERLQRKGEAGPLTPEDESQFADLSREFVELDEHRKALERKSATENLRKTREDLRHAVERSIGRGHVESGSTERGGYVNDNEMDLDPFLEPDSIQAKRFRNPWDLSEVREFGRPRDEVNQEYRARALSAIEKMPGTTDRIRAAATNILETWDDRDGRLAKMVLVTSSPEYMRAWTKVITGRGNVLTAEERSIIDRAMSLTDADGGYLVPFQLDPTVIITSSGSLNEIRRIARTVVATTDVWYGVSAAAGTWSWDSEAAQVSDDSPTLAQPSVPNYKGAGFVPASIESLQDMANATAEIGRILAFGKDYLEATAFATGSGTGQPTGIVTALVASSPTVIKTSAASDTFAIADVYTLDGDLPERHQAGASWLANRKIYNLIRQFDTAGGAGMWERIGNGLPPELLGQGAFRAEAMDGAITGSAENYVLIHGDFSNYVIADRIGFNIEPISHLFGANGRPTGERGFYAYYRVGADSVNDDAFRILNVT